MQVEATVCRVSAIFVITMPERRERAERTVCELTNARLFRAVDGRHWRHRHDFEAAGHKRYFRDVSRWSRGQMGAAISHAKIWEWLVVSREDLMVILEDDARPLDVSVDHFIAWRCAGFESSQYISADDLVVHEGENSTLDPNGLIDC